jgi:hypothetical protein
MMVLKNGREGSKKAAVSYSLVEQFFHCGLGC